MPRLKQSVCWWCFENRLEPDVFMRHVARIGFDAIELIPQEHFNLTRKHGLRIATHQGHQSIGRGMNDRHQHERIEAEVLENLKLAETWQIPVLIVFSGNRYGLTDDLGGEITADILRRLVPYARDAGVTLALELLNSKIDHPNYMADHTSWGLRVCELVESASVRLLYDAYHMQIMEGDVLRTINAWGPMFAHYHVAGVPGRHEPDENQELNFPALARAIAQWEPNGYVGHEWLPTRDLVQSLEAAFQIFNLEF
jgi:hydroxypyruvate isomerase